MKGYMLAMWLTEPLRAFAWWVESAWWKEYGHHYLEDGENDWQPSRWFRMLGMLQRWAERQRAIVFLWLARNGEGWTLWRAVKATIVLVLARYQCKDGFDWWKDRSDDLCWWGQHCTFKRCDRYPQTWEFIEVGLGWRNWWFVFNSDSDDSGYP